VKVAYAINGQKGKGVARSTFHVEYFDRLAKFGLAIANGYYM